MVDDRRCRRGRDRDDPLTIALKHELRAGHEERSGLQAHARFNCRKNGRLSDMGPIEGHAGTGVGRLGRHLLRALTVLSVL